MKYVAQEKLCFNAIHVLIEMKYTCDPSGVGYLHFYIFYRHVTPSGVNTYAAFKLYMYHLLPIQN